MNIKRLYPIFSLFIFMIVGCTENSKSNDKKKHEWLLLYALTLPQEKPLTTVASVDPAKFLGTWYEIASLPQFFQRDCNCVSATYSSIDSTTVGVFNKCRKGSPTGSETTINGKAYIVPDSGNAKLEVEFFPPFRSKYWILALDSDYTYTMVGDPTRNSLWILSRTRNMTDSTKASLTARAKELEFDTSKLQDMVQTGCTD